LRHHEIGHVMVTERSVDRMNRAPAVVADSQDSYFAAAERLKCCGLETAKWFGQVGRPNNAISVPLVQRISQRDGHLAMPSVAHWSPQQATCIGMLRAFASRMPSLNARPPYR
jgi:hypothetical protein